MPKVVPHCPFCGATPYAWKKRLTLGDRMTAYRFLQGRSELLAIAKEIEESDVDGTIDWADRIREIVR